MQLKAIQNVMTIIEVELYMGIVVKVVLKVTPRVAESELSCCMFGYIPECVIVARDVRCGTLQCVNTAELIHASEYNYVSNRSVTITHGLNTFTCRFVCLFVCLFC